MKRYLLSVLILVAGSFVTLQAVTGYYFYVQFSDKNGTPYALSNPSEFLSARAIARRADFNISCDSTDLPVNPSYVSQITGLGITIHSKSKWMNGVTVLVTDSSIMSSVRALPCVSGVQYTGLVDVPMLTPVRQKVKFETEALDYGSAATQINQVNGGYLHNLGYTGQDIQIAILDAGFNNADVNIGFDSLRLQGRLLGIKDIAQQNDTNVYNLDAHGANVLSIMTGNLPAQYLGSAPHASFLLIRTEYAPSEYLVETDFWVSGIEYADSMGVDVVNSSLGYTEFNDASMNYTYDDLDGTVSRASKAATLASQKGMIVCNSAGNSGAIAWHYISVPADADGIITVGSVTSTGTVSSFSSYGPTSDARVKPEICAMGSSTAYINTAGSPASGNGTSFSSPVIAGLMACYLQYTKDIVSNYTVQGILASVFESGSLYASPTAQMGYGIPDFQYAASYLLTLNDVQNKKDGYFTALTDDENSSIKIRLFELPKDYVQIRVYSATGNFLFANSFRGIEINIFTHGLSAGIYFVQVSGDGFSQTQKIIIR